MTLLNILYGNFLPVRENKIKYILKILKKTVELFKSFSISPKSRPILHICPSRIFSSHAYYQNAVFAQLQKRSAKNFHFHDGCKKL